MHHVAIMKKSWGLVPKILAGEKKIESRWYKTKRAPFGKIGKGDTVYFKNSSGPVTVKAEVKNIKEFDNLNPRQVKEILEKWGDDDGISKGKIPEFYELFKDKKYCMLIFLKNPHKIKPFDIDKTGFGMMSAWITVDNVNKIKR